MRARVYDKVNNTYYISEVYGNVNFGGDRYIVGRQEENGFILYLKDYIELGTKPPYNTGIEWIDYNPSPDDMPYVYKHGEELTEFNRLLEEKYHHKAISYFRGYEYIWEQKEQLAELLAKTILSDGEIYINVVDTRLKDWNYIETDSDIKELMKKFLGFHDSVLKEMHYISGDYSVENGLQLSFAGDKKISMVFDSEWSESIEIVFDSIRLVQLAVAGDNFTSELFDASIFVRDCKVYFYDTYMEEIPETYNGTYVEAMGMRWRLKEHE